MSWWQALSVAVISIWLGVAWIEDAVEKIVARRLAAHLINLEAMLIERGIISPDTPWPDDPNDNP